MRRKRASLGVHQAVVYSHLTPWSPIWPSRTLHHFCYDSNVNPSSTRVCLVLARCRHECRGWVEVGVGGGTAAGGEDECWPHSRPAHSPGSHTFQATPDKQTLLAAGRLCPNKRCSRIRKDHSNYKIVPTTGQKK